VGVFSKRRSNRVKIEREVGGDEWTCFRVSESCVDVI